MNLNQTTRRVIRAVPLLSRERQSFKQQGTFEETFQNINIFHPSTSTRVVKRMTNPFQRTSGVMIVGKSQVNVHSQGPGLPAQHFHNGRASNFISRSRGESVKRIRILRSVEPKTRVRRSLNPRSSNQSKIDPLLKLVSSRVCNVIKRKIEPVKFYRDLANGTSQIRDRNWEAATQNQPNVELVRVERNSVVRDYSQGTETAKQSFKGPEPMRRSVVRIVRQSAGNSQKKPVLRRSITNNGLSQNRVKIIRKSVAVRPGQGRARSTINSRINRHQQFAQPQQIIRHVVRKSDPIIVRTQVIKPVVKKEVRRSYASLIRQSVGSKVRSSVDSRGSRNSRQSIISGLRRSINRNSIKEEYKMNYKRNSLGSRSSRRSELKMSGVKRSSLGSRKSGRVVSRRSYGQILRKSGRDSKTSAQLKVLSRMTSHQNNLRESQVSIGHHRSSRTSRFSSPRRSNYSQKRISKKLPHKTPQKTSVSPQVNKSKACLHDSIKKSHFSIQSMKHSGRNSIARPGPNVDMNESLVQNVVIPNFLLKNVRLEDMSSRGALSKTTVAVSQYQLTRATQNGIGSNNILAPTSLVEVPKQYKLPYKSDNNIRVRESVTRISYKNLAMSPANKRESSIRVVLKELDESAKMNSITKKTRLSHDLRAFKVTAEPVEIVPLRVTVTVNPINIPEMNNDFKINHHENEVKSSKHQIIHQQPIQNNHNHIVAKATQQHVSREPRVTKITTTTVNSQPSRQINFAYSAQTNCMDSQLRINTNHIKEQEVGKQQRFSRSINVAPVKETFKPRSDLKSQVLYDCLPQKLKKILDEKRIQAREISQNEVKLSVEPQYPQRNSRVSRSSYKSPNVPKSVSFRQLDTRNNSANLRESNGSIKRITITERQSRPRSSSHKIVVQRGAPVVRSSVRQINIRDLPAYLPESQQKIRNALHSNVFGNISISSRSQVPKQDIHHGQSKGIPSLQIQAVRGQNEQNQTQNHQIINNNPLNTVVQQSQSSQQETLKNTFKSSGTWGNNKPTKEQLSKRQAQIDRIESTIQKLQKNKRRNFFAPKKNPNNTSKQRRSTKAIKRPFRQSQLEIALLSRPVNRANKQIKARRTPSLIGRNRMPKDYSLNQRKIPKRKRAVSVMAKKRTSKNAPKFKPSKRLMSKSPGRTEEKSFRNSKRIDFSRLLKPDSNVLQGVSNNLKNLIKGMNSKVQYSHIRSKKSANKVLYLF